MRYDVSSRPAANVMGFATGGASVGVKPGWTAFSTVTIIGTVVVPPFALSVTLKTWLAVCPYGSEAKSDFASLKLHTIDWPSGLNAAENLDGSETLSATPLTPPAIS